MKHYDVVYVVITMNLISERICLFVCDGRDPGLSSPTFPLTRTSTALASVKSRALLSIDSLDHSSSSSSRPSTSLAPGSSSNKNALIPGEPVVRRWGEKFGLRGFVRGDEGAREEASSVGHVCSCPLEAGMNNSMKHNVSYIQL